MNGLVESNRHVHHEGQEIGVQQAQLLANLRGSSQQL